MEPPVKKHAVNPAENGGVATIDYPGEYSPQQATPIPRQGESTVTAVLRQYSGPLPSPDSFREYEVALPGSANRIVSMAEQNQSHDRLMDWANVGMKFSGQIFMTGLVIVALYISYEFGMAGHDWLAGVVATTTIGTLVGAFALSHRKETPPPKPEPRKSNKGKRK